MTSERSYKAVSVMDFMAKWMQIPVIHRVKSIVSIVSIRSIASIRAFGDSPTAVF